MGQVNNHNFTVATLGRGCDIPSTIEDHEPPMSDAAVLQAAKRRPSSAHPALSKSKEHTIKPLIDECRCDPERLMSDQFWLDTLKWQ